MKNVENEIKKTFINILNQRNIDEIDVQLLSDQLKITRQTFYYHFKNIYDVVFSIIIDRQIEPTEGENLDEISTHIINSFFENEELYREILNSSANDILKESTYSYFNKALNYYLKEHSNISFDARKDIASFLSYGISNQLINCFKINGYNKDDVKIKVKAFLNEQSLNSIVEGYLNNI